MNAKSSSTSAMQSWLRLHDPVLYSGPQGIQTPAASDAARALNRVLNTGATVPVSSGASLTGPNAAAALTTDQHAQGALQQFGALSKPFQDAWTTDPAGGAVTLSELARNAAGYQPQVVGASGANAAAFQNYLLRVGQCPLFILKMSDTVTYTRDTSDWNDAIDAIAAAFKGIAAEDQNTIIDSLKNLAQAASSSMKTTETENLFVQNALDVDDVVTLYLYSSTVSFYETKGKGFDTKQSTFEITQVELEFQSTLWPEYVAQVAAMFTSSVSSWLNNNSTGIPPGTPPVTGLQSST